MATLTLPMMMAKPDPDRTYGALQGSTGDLIGTLQG
jgi:hypothetical protein